MNYGELPVTILLGLSLFAANGCQALLIGAECTAVVGAAAYKEGEVRQREDMSLNGAWSAAQKAMRELGYAVTGEEKDIPHARYRLTAKASGGEKIRITLKGQSDAVTEIRIRVGTFGNASLSALILERIERHY